MPSFRITVDVDDLGGSGAGEIIDDLAQEIRDNSSDFDENGLVVRVFQKVGEGLFERDPGDDIIIEPS